MEPLFLFALVFTILVIKWIYDRIRDWNESRIFWREFEKRIEQQNKEFYDLLYQSLLNSPEFVQAIRTLIEKYNNTRVAKMRDKGLITGNSTWDEPKFTKYKEKYIPDNPGWDKTKSSRLERIKQWVINIF